MEQNIPKILRALTEKQRIKIAENLSFPESYKIVTNHDRMMNTDEKRINLLSDGIWEHIVRELTK